MQSMKQYVSAMASRGGNISTPGVVIALYGYRGGTICTAELKIEEAVRLRDQLDNILNPKE